MTDEQLLRLLRAIRDLAITPYPYPADSKNDVALCFALGQIAGTASKALAEHEREGTAASA